ncbi:MAG TPA: hypothetical protein VHF08_00455 [Nitrososphaeraceae archaeon]|nr:hypothetical protein [Nitrososphaeraceae archaeon]
MTRFNVEASFHSFHLVDSDQGLLPMVLFVFAPHEPAALQIRPSREIYKVIVSLSSGLYAWPYREMPSLINPRPLLLTTKKKGEKFYPNSPNKFKCPKS